MSVLVALLCRVLDVFEHTAELLATAGGLHAQVGVVLDHFYQYETEEQLSN
jgi:hypothetical protein